MSDRTSYAPGTPCWVQLGTLDPNVAASFYGDLLGWTVKFLPDDEGNGLFFLDGKYAAGIRRVPREGTAPAWESYISTGDIDATVGKVEAAGGKVVVAPIQLEESGKIAVFADPEGAHLNIWEPLDHAGAGVVNELGAYCWNELNTRDKAVAKNFYPQVFGWQPRESEGEDYLEWTLEGRTVAGTRTLPPDAAPKAAPHWLVYFAVADVEKSASVVKRAGGEQLTEFADSPAGRLAVFTDPWGARFALISGLVERS
jgi:predicted enzyme related to lactoylglutathione lyase